MCFCNICITYYCCLLLFLMNIWYLQYILFVYYNINILLHIYVELEAQLIITQLIDYQTIWLIFLIIDEKIWKPFFILSKCLASQPYMSDFSGRPWKRTNYFCVESKKNFKRIFTFTQRFCLISDMLRTKPLNRIIIHVFSFE